LPTCRETGAESRRLSEAGVARYTSDPGFGANPELEKKAWLFLRREMKASERRKFHRINVDEDVFMDFSDNTSDCSRIKNISLGGMFILGHSLLKEKETCRIRFLHNAKIKEPRLRASARVVWSGGRRRH
jgi:hypothetical protein